MGTGKRAGDIMKSLVEVGVEEFLIKIRNPHVKITTSSREYTEWSNRSTGRVVGRETPGAGMSGVVKYFLVKNSKTGGKAV
jgi:hypothetical protein